jgi:molecular chaperone DnaK (HSP70)
VAHQTISIGIDLGTTNSSVAVNNNNAIEIVKKPGGLEYTPSVFGFDKAKNKVVGQRAYDSLYSETSDAGIHNFKPGPRTGPGSRSSTRPHRRIVTPSRYAHA